MYHSTSIVKVLRDVWSPANFAQNQGDKLQRELELDLEGSAPFWRRVTQAQCLWSLALFISAGLAQGQTLHQIIAPLLRSVCGG